MDYYNTKTIIRIGIGHSKMVLFSYNLTALSVAFKVNAKLWSERTNVQLLLF